MSGSARPRVVVDLWAVQQLTSFGVTLGVRTFLVLCLWLWAALLAISAAVSRMGVGLAEQFLGSDPVTADARLGGVAAACVAGLAYLVVLELLRERYSNARFAVSRSRVRGLWVALDMPLRTVVLVERGLLVAVRTTMLLTVLGTAALSLLDRGDGRLTRFLLLACTVPLAYGAAAIAIALRQAPEPTVAPLPNRLVVLLVGASTVLGYALSLSARAAAGPVRPGAAALQGGSLEGVVSAVTTAISIAGPLALLASVLVLVAAWRADGDHRPEVTEASDDTATSSREPSVLRTVVHGTGGPRRIPIVARGLVVLACVTAAVAGAFLDRGVLADGPLAGPAMTRLVVVAGAAAATMVSSSVLMLAGQTARLWHYRTLWELGVSERRLFASAVTFSVVPGAAFCLLLAALSAMLAGRIPVVLPLVMLAVVLGDHVADSFFARPVTSDGDARSSNTLLALLGYALMLPAVLVGMAGQPWSAPLLVLYVLALGTGGAWWFGRRIRSLVVLPAP